MANIYKLSVLVAVIASAIAVWGYVFADQRAEDCKAKGGVTARATGGNICIKTDALIR